RAAAARTASITAGNSVRGARRGGSAFNPRSTSCSRSCSFMGRHVLLQGFAAPMNVGLDLAQRRAEQGRNLLITLLFVVVEHERHALVLGQPAEALLERLPGFCLIEPIGRNGGRNGRLEVHGCALVALAA